MAATIIYGMDDIAEFATAKEHGMRLEVDQELFYYFLEVLPPVHMSYMATVASGARVSAWFGFAEGAELVTAFWKQGGCFYAQLTTERNPYC